MLILADHRLPEEGKQELSRYGDLAEFKTWGIVYESISGHPDIFICQVKDEWIIAPNLPDTYKDLFIKRNIIVRVGEQEVGGTYPETARYNAVSTGNVFIHNLHLSDPRLLLAVEGDQKLHCNQGYTRCNLMALGENSFITSDPAIHRLLLNNHMDSLFVIPDEIRLADFKHGFFGGACGIWKQNVFITGSLDNLTGGNAVRSYIESKGYTIIELFDGPLLDGGGILFLESKGDNLRM